MRPFLTAKSTAAALLFAMTCAPGQSADLPDYFKTIVGTRVVWRCRSDLQAQHFKRTPDHSRIVLWRRRKVHPLSVGHAAARRTVRSDRLSIVKISRPQHDGVG